MMLGIREDIRLFIGRQRELFNQFRYELTPEGVKKMFEEGILNREKLEPYVIPGVNYDSCVSSPKWLFGVVNIAGMAGILTHLACFTPEQCRVQSFPINDVEQDYGVLLDNSFENQIVNVLYEEEPLSEGNWIFIVGCRFDYDQTLYREPEFYALVSINRTLAGYTPQDIKIYTSRKLSNIVNCVLTMEQRLRYHLHISTSDLETILLSDDDDSNDSEEDIGADVSGSDSDSNFDSDSDSDFDSELEFQEEENVVRDFKNNQNVQMELCDSDIEMCERNDGSDVEMRNSNSDNEMYDYDSENYYIFGLSKNFF
jgi:hypothetical protein